MLSPIWFVRMSKWVRHPPSPARLKLIGVVVAVCAGIVVLEHFGLWPDWAQSETRPPRLRP